MKIVNLTRSTIIAEEVEIADTILSRMKGLLFRKSLAKSHALIIKPTSSIHTFFMRFPIDIVFLDKQNKILKLKVNVPPFRIILCPPRAKSAVELPSGTLHSTHTQIGDHFAITA
jgi:hypothetical protein